MEATVRWHMVFLLAACPAVSTVLKENHYHTYHEMTTFLKYIDSTYKQLTRLYSIGRSVRGKDLWVIELAGGNREEPLRPNIKLVANIHGTEAVGRELALAFIQYLVEEYTRNNPELRELLDYAKIHVLPSLNPDGFDLALTHFHKNNGSLYCDEHKGWTNYKYKDLNQNFPISGNRSELERVVHESVAVMRWMEEVPFVLSLSLKGSALVATYPYDVRRGSETVTKDNTVFRSLALLYSNYHPSMRQGCVHHAQPLVFKDGVTNGCAWTPTPDSMQDYNYIVHGCLELTVEVSCCKFPGAGTLTSYWNDNRKSMLEVMKQIQKGIRGYVKDEEGSFVPNATLTINGSLFRTTSRGEYWRILLPEHVMDYTVTVEGASFQQLQKVIELEMVPSTVPQVVNFTLCRIGSKSSLCQLTTSSATTANPLSQTPQYTEPQDSVYGLDYSSLVLVLSWITFGIVMVGISLMLVD